MAANEQMAIDKSEGSSLRHEPRMVQKAGVSVSPLFYTGDSQTIGFSSIEEGLTGPVRAVLLGGGGHFDHFLPDSCLF